MDSYPTDLWILDLFGGWFDPCPLNDYPDIDGLNIEWGGKTYVNPPYSNPLPWVIKAIEENNKGKVVVMLLKMDTSTKWFMKLQEAGAKFLWINGRMTSSNGLKSIVSYFGSMPRNSLYLNRFGQRDSKDLMCESLNGISLNRIIASLSGGDYYGTSIQTFQSNNLQFGCEDSNSEEWFSLQV